MFIDSRTQKKNNKGRFVSFPIIDFLVDEGLNNQRKTIFMCLYTEFFFLTVLDKKPFFHFQFPKTGTNGQSPMKRT